MPHFFLPHNFSCLLYWSRVGLQCCFSEVYRNSILVYRRIHYCFGSSNSHTCITAGLSRLVCNLVGPLWLSVGYMLLCIGSSFFKIIVWFSMSVRLLFCKFAHLSEFINCMFHWCCMMVVFVCLTSAHTILSRSVHDVSVLQLSGVPVSGCTMKSFSLAGESGGFYVLSVFNSSAEKLGWKCHFGWWLSGCSHRSGITGPCTCV